jgi:acetyltransferase-like isoleucine patch superfamily enzyme
LSENIFFDLKKIRRIGRNVIIGKTVRIRYPEIVEIGDDVIIDDFTYISTSLNVDSRVHIAAGCKLIGGRDSHVRIGQFSTLAPNVVIAAGSDDYISGIASPLVPLEYKGSVEIGNVELGRHCIVGSNSTVLPNVRFADGAAVGAQSLVKTDIPAWSLYGGIPARYLKSRNRDEIISLEKKWREQKS